ncbi:hypothetical protein SAMN04487773_3231 [Enterobacter sp. kpr-6]|uniref:hypothetical protein n=1 Tax=Enterobacter sp. kpr-6 TaxID=1761782 RepID=UPI0008E88C89|nr:hypothetical protein [Enterobacter sp. kpr-6]SFR13758.1 hypothetical protein SAMN04487773_3231 [Enterobacter sp. kpr-6]
MTIISVSKDNLTNELEAWRVPMNYAVIFLRKNTDKGGRVLLHPFFFNDTDHMTSPRHWLAANAALWCAAYREAETRESQIEALASIRAMFYAAGALGQGEITTLIQNWWRNTFELHQVPAPNYSAACPQNLRLN